MWKVPGEYATHLSWLQHIGADKVPSTETKQHPQDSIL